jgi:hypothetical protein
MSGYARRCYIDDDGHRCKQQAAYEARLTWTEGRMLLCEDHAQAERAHGDVREIRGFAHPP